jgi:hypothetical protein
MGMYDEIRVEQILPEETAIYYTPYQTKSFECLMDSYVITPKGELYREIWDYKWVENPYAKHSFMSGYQQKIPESYRREYLTNYHGDIIFYSGVKHNGLWRDYYARFTEGKLTRMWYKDYQL